MLGKDWQLGIV